MKRRKVVSRLSLIITLLSIALLVVALPVLAESDEQNLSSDLSNEADINLHVDPYAKLDTNNISGDQWMSGEAPTLSRVSPWPPAGEQQNQKDSFSGRPGETRWARTQVEVRANTPINVTFTEPSFPNDKMNNSWKDGFAISIVSLEEENSFTDDQISWPATYTISNWPEILNDGDGNVFEVIAQATMPDDFWNVKADTYSGKIDVIVSAQ